ncbi:hypothetical protein KUV80_09870 [Fictibacillus nanhaiensis]|uniref:hypothetical protein n=1 Tax=Fictibacillus nanhaiensis TaxID=742169 RepID=UPI001C957CC4|nr:hypothetical protein [Fictibacillus nanhaiensis]MBY6036963.1 hypothetical protein [Fictibacillus nanhaiensis]
MLKFIKMHALCIMAVILFTGCQSNSNTQLDVKMKSDDELREIANTYTYEDYKMVFEEVVSEANELEEDGKLNKWIIRILAKEKLTYITDLTDEQVIQLAEQAMEEDRVWKSIAKDEYEVSVTQKEVENYIKEGPDTSNLHQHQAFADAMGLSLEELNHHFDRDIYEKNVIWLKLKPKLEKKYDTTNDNEQVEKYGEEVESQLK